MGKITRLTHAGLLQLAGKVEVLVHDALKDEQIIGGDFTRVQWVVTPDKVETLCYKGKPLLELHPLEVEQESDGVLKVSRKYRSFV